MYNKPGADVEKTVKYVQRHIMYIICPWVQLNVQNAICHRGGEELYKEKY